MLPLNEISPPITVSNFKIPLLYIAPPKPVAVLFLKDVPLLVLTVTVAVPELFWITPPLPELPSAVDALLFSKVVPLATIEPPLLITTLLNPL